jgi:amino acid transporter
MATDKEEDGSGLEKSVGLVQLTFYGTGTILGAGIFVVIGEVLGAAGSLAPIAYLLAAIVAVTSALSFSEMAARIPTAAGPIDYLEKAFGQRWLGSAAGWALTVANIVSGATITTGFVSYLNSFVTVPEWIATVSLCILLGAVSIIGMRQSTWLMTVTTLIGLVTLCVILWALRAELVAAPSMVLEDIGSFEGGAAAGLFLGAFLAVYSFIGFGDMAQTAEETRNVKRTLPRAMVAALIIVMVFYLAIALALVGTGDTDALSKAKAPLVEAAVQKGWPALPLAIASLFVIVNGALTQIIAAARLLLDLGRDGRGAPAFLGRVNDRTATPIPATLVTLGCVLALALFIPLGTLASATSFVILVVFMGSTCP